MNLTELSYYSRKVWPFAVLFFLIFLIFFYAAKLLFIVLQPSKQQLYLNPIFGKIKQPLIKNTTSSAGLNFTLDTVEGEPVTASESAKVYFLPPAAARFGYREKIYLMAKTLGFDTQIVKHKLVDTEATFTDNKQKFLVDITNFNFFYEYILEDDLQLLENTFIPPKTEIENKAIDFLKTLSRYPEELAKGKTNIIYLHYYPEEKAFSKTEKAKDTNMIEVDFYRPDVNGFSTISPNFPNSQNYVIIVFNSNGFKILRSQIKFFEKSEEQWGVYPLKTGGKAWEELKTGKGAVLSNPQSLKEIIIKSMFTAYLDPDIYQDYFQPVYVFLGEGGFVAYIPAISNDYLSQY